MQPREYSACSAPNRDLFMYSFETMRHNDKSSISRQSRVISLDLCSERGDPIQLRDLEVSQVSLSVLEHDTLQQAERCGVPDMSHAVGIEHCIVTHMETGSGQIDSERNTWRFAVSQLDKNLIDRC